MCWRGNDRYFEAVPVDDTTPNSGVNGEVQSIPEEEMVGELQGEGIHFWGRPCRSQNENRGC